MRCSTCEHDNPADARFCNDCGAALEIRCGACAAENPPGSRFCNACGVALEPVLQREFLSLGERLVNDPMSAHR